MQDQTTKREDYFRQENFRLTEKTEFKLMDNRKKYVSNLLNQKPKIYNLKKKKNLQIEIENLDLPDNYKNFSIKNINQEEESKTIFQMLDQTINPNFIKLAILSLRKYMCEEGRNDEERTINKKEIFDLLLGHFLHSKDFSIKHEIYWIFLNSICQNYYLRTILENDFNFLKRLEEDWEYENSFFITSITLLCTNFLKYSSEFCSNLLKNNFFNKVLGYLLCSKREQIVQPEIIKHSLKLIHSILKFKSHLIDFPMETIEKLLNILDIYFEDFLSEKIFYNILYILYYLIHDFDKKIFLQIFKRDKLIAKILTIDIDTTKQENIVIMLIIKDFLKAEDDKIIDFMLEKDLVNNLLKVFRTAETIEDYKELVMQSLNNLSSGSSQHILAILQTDFYEIIFEGLFSSNKIIQLNSLVIINNCISHFNFSIATKLIESGLIEKLFKLLDASDRNFEKILLLIEIFDSIIELGKYQLSDEDDSLLVIKENNSHLESFIKIGGIEKLDELQKIPNEKINNKTVEFIEKYFKFDDV